MNNPFNKPESVTHPLTPQQDRMRKALLVLPLIILPLLTLAFWNLHRAPNRQPAASSGLSTILPGAAFDKHAKAPTKMSLYDQAQQDAEKAKSNAGNPLLQKMGLNKTPANNDVIQIRQKLAQINREVSQPQQPVNSNSLPADKHFDQQVGKLELLMKTMNTGQQADPQMEQLTKMLAQIQNIQHPQLSKKDSVAATAFEAIPATIDGNQKILQGAAVRLRLNDSVRIKGVVIPKGTLAYGTATITNQRLLVEIKNIRLANAIIPVGLTVYDKDGMPGVPAPEAELAGAAGEGSSDAIENMQLMSMDASLGAQAAAGGISAAKNLFTKKVHRIKVHLKNGYPVLLKLQHA